MPTNITTQPGKADDNSVNKELDDFLRAEAIVDRINEVVPAGYPQLAKIPKEYIFRKRDRETVSVAMHAAFELMGGVPGFAQWGVGKARCLARAARPWSRR